MKNTHYGASDYAVSLQPYITSFPLGTNIPLRTLFSDIIISSLNVREKVSHAYKTLDKL
jgi:hypothetical protein